MSGIILTRPQFSGIPGTVNTGIVIPFTAPSNVAVVDSVLCDYNTSVKWIYTIYSASKDKIMSSEVLASYRSSSNPTHSRYSVTGDFRLLPHTLEVFADGTSLGLKITNLSGGLVNPVDHINYHVNVVRIQLLA